MNNNKKWIKGLLFVSVITIGLSISLYEVSKQITITGMQESFHIIKESIIK